jgi:predicted DNA-binding transcriptional regulator AlpA
MARIIVEKPIEEYPPVLQAQHVKDILGISEAKAYEVLNSRKCPTIRMGKRMVVIRDSFVEFLYANQGGDLTEDNQVRAAA